MGGGRRGGDGVVWEVGRGRGGVGWGLRVKGTPTAPIKHVSAVVGTVVVLEYEKPWRNLELLTLGNYPRSTKESCFILKLMQGSSSMTVF